MSNFEVLHYELVDESLYENRLEEKDKWKVYDYLMKYKADNKRVDLYIPSWLYDYVFTTNLENYNCTLYDALSSCFRIYGSISNSFDAILVIGAK